MASAASLQACKPNPERFSTSTNPKILDLPGTTWINKPAQKVEHEDDVKSAAYTHAGLIHLYKLRSAK